MIAAVKSARSRQTATKLRHLVRAPVVKNDFENRNIAVSQVRQGIPPELRGVFWFQLSGAAEKCELEGRRGVPRYEDICDLGISECSAQIEKDLLRTFPGNEKMGGKDGTDGIDSLRRILTAYSLRNPSVGYCQSMNFLVATLLLFCEEREAFWILATVIEDKLSADFYSMTMLGLQTDLLVLDRSPLCSQTRGQHV